jgi:hypothetical protein
VIYSQNGYTREQSLQAVGPGWAELINRLWDAIDTAKAQGLDMKVVQVKQKFGTLRFYADRLMGPDIDTGLGELIREVEADSARTCEECGEPGKNYNDRTLCITCAIARDLGVSDESA